jgi:hypothetical protein
VKTSFISTRVTWWQTDTLYWTLSSIWGLFDIHDILGVASTLKILSVRNTPQTTDNVQHDVPVKNQPFLQTFRESQWQMIDFSVIN